MSVTFSHVSEWSPIYATRYKELGFQRQGSGNWRFIDRTDMRPVGRSHPTRESLVADMDRYAAFFGCDGAAQPDRCQYCGK